MRCEAMRCDAMRGPELTGRIIHRTYYCTLLYSTVLYCTVCHGGAGVHVEHGLDWAFLALGSWSFRRQRQSAKQSASGYSNRSSAHAGAFPPGKSQRRPHLTSLPGRSVWPRLLSKVSKPSTAMAAPRRMLGTPSETEAAHVAAQGLVGLVCLAATLRGARGGRGGVTASRLRTWWRCYQDRLGRCLYARPIARGTAWTEGRHSRLAILHDVFAVVVIVVVVVAVAVALALVVVMVMVMVMVRPAA